MDIIKKYHFYAAHRNKNAGEKCGRIHGHTYFVECVFDLRMKGDLTILFGDIDKLVEPIIKSYDHYLLLEEMDPLCELLELANEPFIKLNFQTSAENMAVWLYTRIKNETDLNIKALSIKETQSSIVKYEP